MFPAIRRRHPPTRRDGGAAGDLARSGGVIEPPPSPTRPSSRRRAAHTTHADGAGREGCAQKSAPAEAGKLGAAETTALQALLVAARTQAERGAEAECRIGCVRHTNSSSAPRNNGG